MRLRFDISQREDDGVCELLTGTWLRREPGFVLVGLIPPLRVESMSLLSRRKGRQSGYTFDRFQAAEMRACSNTACVSFSHVNHAF